jgi:hypothetical protein
MKSSPLFKASLERSIAKLEGQIATEDLNADAELEQSMPTGSQVCTLAPYTQGHNTCVPFL